MAASRSAAAIGAILATWAAHGGRDAETGDGEARAVVALAVAAIMHAVLCARALAMRADGGRPILALARAAVAAAASWWHACASWGFMAPLAASSVFVVGAVVVVGAFAASVAALRWPAAFAGLARILGRRRCPWWPCCPRPPAALLPTSVARSDDPGFVAGEVRRGSTFASSSAARASLAAAIARRVESSAAPPALHTTALSHAEHAARADVFMSNGGANGGGDDDADSIEDAKRAALSRRLAAARQLAAAFSGSHALDGQSVAGAGVSLRRASTAAVVPKEAPPAMVPKQASTGAVGYAAPLNARRFSCLAGRSADAPATADDDDDAPSRAPSVAAAAPKKFNILAGLSLARDGSPQAPPESYRPGARDAEESPRQVKSELIDMAVTQIFDDDDFSPRLPLVPGVSTAPPSDRQYTSNAVRAAPSSLVRWPPRVPRPAASPGHTGEHRQDWLKPIKRTRYFLPPVDRHTISAHMSRMVATRARIEPAGATGAASRSSPPTTPTSR